MDSTGDNLLAEFVSVVDAVQCAVAVQKEIKARNDELPENRRMQFRIGINLGDVIEEEERIYGDGVNIAARLEGLADPGGICVSKTAFDHIESKLPYGYEFLGDQTVKNIAKPVSAYRVRIEPRVTVAGKPVDKKPATIRRTLILVGAVVVLALIVAVGIWRFTVRHPKEEPASIQKMTVPLPERPAIAVLPFDNMSGDPEQEYFSDGITEEIITKLSMSPGIAVIARNSTFFYKGKQIKIKQIAQELRARYVVEGSVRKAGNRVRITAQLIDATTERNLWAKTYDHEFKVLLADVYRAKGRFEQAISQAERALSLNPSDSSAYRSMGNALNSVGRSEEAVKAIKKAMYLDPHHSVYYHTDLASTYRNLGQYEEAIASLEEALARNPDWIPAYVELAMNYFVYDLAFITSTSEMSTGHTLECWLNTLGTLLCVWGCWILIKSTARTSRDRKFLFGQ